jgi:hypothetical protein
MFLLIAKKKQLAFFYLILPILAGTSSCFKIKNGVIGQATPLAIRLDSTAKHYSLASLIDSVEAIKLETTDSSAISDPINIKRIIYKDDKFFVFDQRYFAIKVFDRAGKYLYDICKLGLGPGESMHIEDIELDNSHNLLMVLSNRPVKLLTYTLNGHLVKEENLDFFSSALAMPSAGSRIYYVNQNQSELSTSKNLLITDASNQLKCRIFDFPKNIYSTTSVSGGLYSTDQGIYFNPAFSDTIYTITGDTARAAFIIDHGSRSIPPGMTENEIYKDYKNLSFQSVTFGKFRDLVCFNYLDRGISAAFFNTRSGNLATSDTRLDSLNLLFSNSVFENNGKLTMILDLNRLSGFLQRNANAIKQRYPELYAHLSIPKGKQNPLLLNFTVKEF